MIPEADSQLKASFSHSHAEYNITASTPAPPNPTIAPLLKIHNSSHSTSHITGPPRVHGTIHISKDSENRSILAISTETNQSDIAVSTAQEFNVVGVPEALAGVGTEDNYDEFETPMSDAPPLRTGRVRFRSRVRITSGLNRRKQKSGSEHDYLTFSSSSSLSGSPSSSISAPLRTHEEDDVGKPGWGTLGQRVSMFVHANGQRTKPRERRGRTSSMVKTQSCTNNGHRVISERTPLTGGNCQTFEGEPNLSREIELVFGPWPNRLLNQHWWWWHLEPLICCHCLVEESDDEG